MVFSLFCRLNYQDFVCGFLQTAGSVKAWDYYHEIMCPFPKILNHKSSGAEICSGIDSL